ncbi:MAG: hypothetical protein AB7P03_20070 [Kofleriaceae bacterium]
MSNKNELATLDLTTLSAVTGGVTDNQQMTTALTGILDSVKDLTTQQKPAFGAQEMMMVMMLSERNREPASVVVAPPRYWY